MGDEKTESQGPEWASIAEAARDESVKARTLYRWRKTNAIASKVEDGVILVRLADVRARAGRGRRQTPMPANDNATAVAIVGAPAGAHAGNGTMAGKLTTTPAPELVARLFRLFDEGVALEAIVQREQLLPQVVLDLHRQYESLLAAGGRPSLSDRMAALEEKTARQFVDLDGYFKGVKGEFEFHEQRLSSAEERIGVLGEKSASIDVLWQRVQRLEQAFALANATTGKLLDLQEQQIQQLRDLREQLQRIEARVEALEGSIRFR